MSNEALAAIIAAVIAAVGAIAVALIRRAGDRAARHAPPGPAQHESGEHAHTRDLLKEGMKGLHRRCEGIERAQDEGIRGLHRRFDDMERKTGEIRQHAQIGDSIRRVGRNITSRPKG